MNHNIINELTTNQIELEFYKDNIRQLLPLFGQELQKARESGNKTVKSICEELGISVGFYYDLERGARKPNKEILEKIKKIFPDDYHP